MFIAKIRSFFNMPCMYVCMYLCMLCVCIYIYIFFFFFPGGSEVKYRAEDRISRPVLHQPTNILNQILFNNITLNFMRINFTYFSILIIQVKAMLT